MNKHVIITGSARGIGHAIATRLASEGYYIIALDIDTENGLKLETELNGNCSFFTLDITNSNALESFFKLFVKRFGSLHGLVNNAGIIKDNLIWNMPLSDFESVININLKGCWMMCKEASQLMRDQQFGRIVNIASRAWLGNRGQSNYSASKGGIVSLTRVLALELGKYNVLVNSVAPGLIDTPMTQGLNPDVLERLIKSQPTRTIGKPDNVAHAVSFLLDENTDFITGQTLYVDGGKSIGAGI